MFTSSSSYEDLGIFIILPNDLQEQATELSQTITGKIKGLEGVKPPIKNIFHISLFQGRFPKDQISNLNKELQEVTQNNQSFKVDLIPSIDNSMSNLFWNTKMVDEIKKLHHYVEEIGKKYKNGRIPQYEDIYKKLTDNSSEDKAKKKILEEVGILETGNSYKSHITLYYNSGDNKEINEAIKGIEIPPYALKVDKIGIGRLGYDGNLKEIIDGFSLKAGEIQRAGITR